MTRRSSFGQVRKLPSGRYQARSVVPGTTRFVNGPNSFLGKRDARAWLTTEEDDLIRGT